MYTFYNKFQFPYIVGQVIGQGTYGTVYSVHHYETGREYAMKVIPKAKEMARRELAIHMQVSGIPHTVPIEEVIDDTDYLMVFMPRLHESLGDRLMKKGALPVEDVVAIVYDLLHWLRQVHLHGVCYCDLKPGNIMLHEGGSRPYMIDFGCSRRLPLDGSPLRSRAGTVLYMAPEVIMRQYDARADLWSLGVLTYYMLTGQYPLKDLGETVNRDEYMRRILTFEKRDIRAHPRLSAEALEFVESLMTFEPTLRASATDALLMPFLEDYVSAKRIEL